MTDDISVLLIYNDFQNTLIMQKVTTTVKMYVVK